MQPTVPIHAATALVTGASRGIGRAIAHALGAAGRPVVCVGRDSQSLAATVSTLSSAHVVTVDLRSDAAVATLTADARAHGPLGVLVHNAGTAPTEKFERTSLAVLDEVLDLHVRVPFRLTQALLDDLTANGGVVVHVASSAGLRGFPFTTAYTAAKHAMVGLARALHAELKPRGVAVYAVCPGFVDTDITRHAAAAIAARGKTTAAEALARMAAMNRIGRMHTADEVAAAVARVVGDRPDGCVLDLDREHPDFV
jgi:3-hydroxybutyrate dehydrogenase